MHLQKVKKVPQRKCIACQDRDNKKELIRIVKNKEGHIFLDKTGKANGRGAYICNCSECLKKAIKSNALSRAFKMEIPEEVYESLIKEIEDNE
ncbi:nucleic acid-binding protein [Paraclostridium bifermentans]|uniref:YlxR family protein n=1 Tax=Paraclostridium bifermentans TaxID=1490 RepID=A0A5P3XJY6_PARBF|nr:YlxR family protein [Paraclostridium bifermentans]RIZ58926.1 nucleic acid-binding protein [Paraclostridium bifermentans]TQO58398.1 YlxR family protein [Paraclostridium bifermentans]